MVVTAWRICKRAFQKRAYSVASSNNSGRWTSEGVSAVYAAGSVSLAHLELLAHLKPAEIHEHFVLCPCSFDESLVDVVRIDALPKSWRKTPPPRALQKIGDEWAKSLRSPVLAVPSALVPQEYNYVLNLLHPDFKKIKLCTKIPIRLDARLLKRV